MAIVVGTVPLLLAFDPDDFGRQFLLLVAIFSGYFVFSGYRVLSRKRPADEAQTIDWLGAGLVTVASLGLGVLGLVLVGSGTQGSFGNIGIVMIVFGGLGGSFGVSDLRAFRRADRRGPWMADHLGRMIGGYIATVTAVSVVNVAAFVPAPVAWLWPTAVGVPLIWYWQGTFTNTGPLAGVVS